ncbi:MAG: tRNA (adenosine(37)-N6)-threonylcarbamoyltransferase complex dimerization subunit type 1 TsaB [Hyphomicrobiales bacterium]
MLILAVDTALGACSAAIYDSASGRVLARRHEPMERGHAERLPLMVEEIFAEAGLGPEQIDRLAATSGPGSFTGVRIGLSMARGLALAIDKPAVGVGTLEAMAAAVSDAPAGAAVCAAIDARRGEVYVERFAAGAASTPRLLPLADAAAACGDGSVVLVGSGAPLLLPLLPEATLSAAPPVPDAVTVARLAATRDPHAHPPEPLYLRTADAKPPAKTAVDVAIVEAGAGDCALLSRLHDAAFDDGWSEEDFARLMAMPGAIALIAGPGTTAPPAAFLFARAAAGEAEIITIGTVPAARRHGLARRLVEHLFALLAGRGISELFIEVASRNAPAIALYRAMGFTACGRRARYYDLGGGDFDDALVMKRAL